MSEYQYYEFQVLDDELTDKQLAALRRISSRAELTPTSFFNEYHWGDLKADPVDLMRKYYDAGLYYTNWCSHRLLLRFPADTVDARTLKKYECNSVDIVKSKNHVIVDLSIDSDAGDWDTPYDTTLDSLLALREEIQSGDFRALYLGWLAGFASWEMEDEALEPPVPAGLVKPTKAQKRLMEFLHIDRNLLAVAAKASPAAGEKAAGGMSLDVYLGRLPAKEKNALLRALLNDDGTAVRKQVLAKYRQASRKNPAGSRAASPSRTAGELRELCEATQSKKGAREK